MNTDANADRTEMIDDAPDTGDTEVLDEDNSQEVDDENVLDEDSDGVGNETTSGTRAMGGAVGNESDR